MTKLSRSWWGVLLYMSVQWPESWWQIRLLTSKF